MKDHESQNGKAKNETMWKKVGEVRNRHPEGFSHVDNQRVLRTGSVERLAK